MWFDFQSYLTNSLNVKVKQQYLEFLKSGLLIDSEILYLLIVGKCDKDNNTAFLKKIDFNLDDYQSLIRILNSFKNCSFYITPHIFTKFIHLLWENIENKDEFYKVINILSSSFNFIGEKYIHKDEIIGTEHFKKKYYDLPNTSLILTGKKYNHKAIITCKKKTAMICEESGNFLTIYYPDIKSAILTIPCE